MTEDKSDFNKLTMMDRRKFLSGLLAVGAASSVLPVGVGVNETSVGPLPPGEYTGTIIDFETRDSYHWTSLLMKIELVNGKVVKSELVKLKDTERDDAGNYLLTT